MWDVRRIFLILFENLFKPRQLYLQPQSCALSDLWISFLVCFLIFIEYKSKKYVKKQPLDVVAFVILFNSVMDLHLRYGY